MSNVPCTTEDLIVGTFNLCLDDVDLGATAGEVTITQDNNWEEVRNGQSRYLQTKFNTQQDWMITATMRTLSLDRLRIYFGVKAGLTGSTLCFKDEGGCLFPEEFALTILGPGPGCGCRNIHFPRVIICPDSLEYIINREALAELEVQFQALPTCDGVIGCITDVCGVYATDVDDTENEVVCAEGTIPNYVAPTTGAP